MVDDNKQTNSRILEAGALRAMAHPVRADLYEALSAFGPATATQLGLRLGESSGSTSYHLRQLAKHGLVREVEGRGTTRERWWERVPGGIDVSYYDHDDEASRVSAQMVARLWERSRAALLDDFQNNPETVGPDWYRASTLDTANFNATIDELKNVVRAWHDFDEKYLQPLRGRKAEPGARRIQVHFNAFPLIDTQAAPPTESASPSEGS
jgi:DNA-binding transcriptional ArsR family regulator